MDPSGSFNQNRNFEFKCFSSNNFNGRMEGGGGGFIRAGMQNYFHCFRETQFAVEKN